MLNSLYGKFAQSPIRLSKNVIFDDGKLSFSDFESECVGGYIPIGAYITALARNVTVRAALENYDNFCYADTDSIHLTAPAVGIDIDDSELGKWCNESNFTSARFVRQKTYIESDGDDFIVKCAGMPANVKRNFLENSVSPVNDFTIGLEVFGKLMRKKVKGGAYLYPSTFKIM